MRREIFLLFFLLFLCLGNIFSRHFLTPQSIPLILLSIIILIVASRYTKLSFFLIFFTIGILGEQYSPFEKIFHAENQISIENIFSEEREKVSVQMDSLYKKYDSEATAIIKALSIGVKDDIGEQTWENFRKSGAMHLLALSGMHLGIIYGILHILFSIMGNYPWARRLKSLAIILLIWYYTIFTGGAVSLLRAAIMTTAYELANLLNREKNGLNALCISGFIIVLLWPQAPESAGFQLSFGAMLGIFLIYPHLKGLPTPPYSIIRYIWNISLFSISCTFFTMPILYFRFESYAMFSLLTNLLCAPLTTIAMTLIPLSIVAIPISSGLHHIVNFLLFKTIEIMIFINEILSHS